MAETTFNAFVDCLPRRGANPLEVVKVNPSFKSVVDWPDRFVASDMRCDEDARSSHVVLLSAPGAMGKSISATALANSTQSPLVDLAQMRLGSNSLTGLLARTLGWSGAARFAEDLGEGRTCLVLDSLDEAQLQAGRDHLNAFLADVAQMLEGRPAMNQVIMLGRPDSMDTAELLLGDKAVSTCHYTLLPLGREQAASLIDAELDSYELDGLPYTVHRNHAEPFARLRDIVLSDLAQGLGVPELLSDSSRWNLVRDFLGYPPVSMSIARRLAVVNPKAELERLGDQEETQSGIARGKLLASILEQILDREAKKVADQVGQILGIPAGSPQLRTIYTRGEQVLRILQYASQSPLELAPPQSLTPSQRATYEEQIELFVPDHPFLVGRMFANVVFSDYVRAYLATDPDISRLHGTHVEALLNGTASAGPFFVYFLHGLTVQYRGWGSIVERDVDQAIKSFVASSSSRPFFYYVHRKASATLRLTATGILGNDDSLLFEVSKPDGILELTGPLSSGLVITNSYVILSSVGDVLELGPYFGVSAQEIQLRCRRMVVSSGQERTPGSVFFIAGDLEMSSTATVSSTPTDALRVTTPERRHPWSAYWAELEAQSVGDPARVNYFVFALRRILTSFKGGAGSDPSQHKDFMDRIIVGNDDALVLAWDALIETGLVEMRSSAYYLSLSRLAPFGVSYVALTSPDFAKALSVIVEHLATIPAVAKFLQEAD